MFERPTQILGLIALMMTFLAGFDAAGRAATVITADNAGRVVDNNNDDLGNIAISNQPASAVGEPGSGNENDEGRFVVYFNLDTAGRAAAAVAESITLDIVMDRTGGNSAALAGFAVDLYGFEDVTFTDIVAGQYQQAATLLQSAVFTSADAGPSNTNLKRSFDVTGFVKTEAARSATSSVAFRFQVDPATLPIDEGKQVYWVLEGTGGGGNIAPTLTLIPEPATAALLSLGALALMRRRRG